MKTKKIMMLKTSENKVKYSIFYMGEMNKSRELYSKEGDNPIRFEGKIVPWEHTIDVHNVIIYSDALH